jgi:digeranylgeranylglycerophospholipid reductase
MKLPEGGTRLNVAIIGAGISGLACAGELEKYGITPVIYEKKSYIGDAYPHVSVLLEIARRPVRDGLKYLRGKYDININPINTINAIVHNSPGKTTTIKGKFGYFLKNNREPDCIRNQLFNRLKEKKIRLETLGEYDKLEKEYDRVVIATGQSVQAQELGCWQSWTDSYVKGACVAGNFDPNTMVMWLNKDYCKDGYAYMTPFSRERASIILVVTDVEEKGIDSFWSLFLAAENIKYEMIETYKLSHQAGYVYPLTIGKIIFAGNSAGGFDPFLGFGILHAVKMGVAAARTIATGISYEDQIRSVLATNKRLRQFRKAFNTLTNKDYDNIVTLLGLPGIKHLLYDTGLNIVKIGATLRNLLTKDEG